MKMHVEALSTILARKECLQQQVDSAMHYITEKGRSLNTMLEWYI